MLYGLGKKFNSNTTGIDYKSDLTIFAEAQNLKILHGRIEDQDLNQKFDLITMSHVLEHLLNPKETLIEINKHLTPGGIILIEVPSIDNLLNGAYNYDFLKYFQNMHIHHFTIESLKNLFCEIDMDILYVDSKTRLIAKKSNLSKEQSIENKFSDTMSLIMSIERKRTHKSIKIRILLKSLKGKLVSYYNHLFNR